LGSYLISVILTVKFIACHTPEESLTSSAWTPTSDEYTGEKTPVPWLLDPEIQKHFFMYRIVVELGVQYATSSTGNTWARTLSPLQVQSSSLAPNEVALTWKDKRSKEIKGNVPFTQVKPTTPKKGGLAIIIEGKERGTIVTYHGAPKNSKGLMVDVRTRDNGQKHRMEVTSLCRIEEP
jgi:hypothetical protein